MAGGPGLSLYCCLGKGHIRLQTGAPGKSFFIKCKITLLRTCVDAVHLSSATPAIPFNPSSISTIAAMQKSSVIMRLVWGQLPLFLCPHPRASIIVCVGSAPTSLPKEKSQWCWQTQRNSPNVLCGRLRMGLLAHTPQQTIPNLHGASIFSPYAATLPSEDPSLLLAFS